MNKILGGIALSALLAAPAMAADIPARMPVKGPVPVVAAAYNWTGFYTASSIGVQWWDINGTYVAPPPDRHNTDGSKGIYGSHIGYQIQTGSLVFGVEAAYNSVWGSDYTGSLSVSGDCLGGSAIANRTCESRIKNYWTAGGKLGFAFNNFLVYGTGGYANGRIQTDTIVTTTGVLTSITSGRHGGWYAGAGIDMFVTKIWWSDLIIGIEYQHVDLESRLHVDVLPGATGINNRNMSATDDVIRAKATFKYSIGGPVVARY
jgi:outer membrane immunogenic protein